VSTIIECPACTTRYKMNKPIPEGGRSVKCARCGHQWRIVPDEPEELTEAYEAEEPAAEASPATAFAAASAEHRAADDEGATAAGAFRESRSDFPSPPASASWDARRGNLAAAIASMSDAVKAETPQPNYAPAMGHQAAFGDWTSDRAGFAAHSEETEAEPEADPTDDTPLSGLQHSGQTVGAETSGSDLAAWRHIPSWSETGEAPPAAAPAIDAENSVRQALRAALEDQESGRADGAGLSRPVFADSEADDTSGVVSEEGAAALANAFGDTTEPAEEDPYAEAQKGLSSRWETFRAGETPATAAFGAPSDDGSEKFESDIAGIFRQGLHQKRSFGHGPAKRGADTGYTDYDSDAGSEAADDRYMADSPLDADAAALQAALEGSLREKQAAEGRGSSGGLALAAAWAVFISVLSGVTMAFISFRNDIVVALPGTAALYSAVGLGVQNQQIDFGKVNYRWTVADGKPMIEVTGQIINLTDREIAVPRVLINVHDKETTDTVKATATLRSEPLAAHETADFTLEFISPSKTVSQIELAFAEKTE
jgi:predicted Zn finger-like uncharacterized protein